MKSQLHSPRISDTLSVLWEELPDDTRSVFFGIWGLISLLWKIFAVVVLCIFWAIQFVIGRPCKYISRRRMALPAFIEKDGTVNFLTETAVSKGKALRLCGEYGSERLREGAEVEEAITLVFLNHSAAEEVDFIEQVVLEVESTVQEAKASSWEESKGKILANLTATLLESCAIGLDCEKEVSELIVPLTELEQCQLDLQAERRERERLSESLEARFDALWSWTTALEAKLAPVYNLASDMEVFKEILGREKFEQTAQRVRKAEALTKAEDQIQDFLEKDYGLEVDQNPRFGLFQLIDRLGLDVKKKGSNHALRQNILEAIADKLENSQ